MLDVLQVGNLTVWLDEPNWQEQVKEAFKQGVSVSLIAPPDARGDFKSVILSLALEAMEVEFLQVHPVMELCRGVARIGSEIARHKGIAVTNGYKKLLKIMYIY
ncbi:hypothetical protein [Nostoc sp.]|uniref:hypothetical protein n=1 Tax=Nostoc sp. TaxID=1180 RepID=UPI002FFA8ACB